VARRSARKTKAKPAKPGKTAKTKKSRGRRGGGDEFEVTDQGSAKANSWNLESGLVLVTFLALLVSFALIQIELSGSFGSTWPF
jgi:hypothetical protein